MNTGIYIILNNKNCKKYIGSAVNIEKRWREHKNVLQKTLAKQYGVHKATISDIAVGKKWKHVIID